MEHPNFETEQVTGEQAGNLATTPTAFDEQLQAFANTLNLDPIITKAYGAERTSIYTVGLPEFDAHFVAELTEAKLKTLELFAERYLAVYSNNFVTPEKEEDVRHEASNNETRRQANSSRIATKSLHSDELWKSAQTLQLIAQLEETRGYGLLESRVVRLVSKANTINYLSIFPETPPADRISIDKYLSPDFGSIYIATLFAGEAVEGGTLTADEVAQRLAQQGYTDLSSEGLDARAENYYRLAQLEAANLFLDGLSHMAKPGGQRRKHALMLANKYRADLTADDYDRKIEMMNDLAAALKVYWRQEHHMLAKLYFGLLAERAEETAISLDELRQGFKLAYEDLGYALPYFLQPAELPALPTVASQVASLTTQNPEVSAADQMILSEIAEQNISLHQDAQTFNSHWITDAERRKEHGFGPMQRELVRGFVNYAGRQIIDPLSKEDAVQLVSTLARLDELSKSDDLASSQKWLQEIFARQHQLEEHRELLQRQVQEKQVRGVVLPDIKQADELISWLRRDWDVIRQLVVKTWPAYEGAAVAERLEQLLLEEPQQHHNDDLGMQAALALQANVAEQLDKIILPPEATPQDLNQELTRLGVSQTTLPERQRLSDLITIRNQYEGTLFRSKEKPLGNALPYFVVVFQLGEETYAVAESAAFGNETYVVAEKHTPDTWLEGLELSKADSGEVGEVGAHKIVRAKKGKGLRHVDKIYNKVLELHLLI